MSQYKDRKEMNKKIAILGGGESGVGTAILAKQKGYEVFLSDFGSIKEKYKKVLENNEIAFESGKHSFEKILNSDLVMKSPGISDTVPLVVQLKEKGISVVSEIEFAARYTNATIIGITGSNGKTTTTMLLNHILKKAEINVGMAGNIGDSFAAQVANEEHDVYVLELSSFQLDGIVDFAPHIAIITNITPDHLDRYDNEFEKYVASKFLITKNQTEKDFLIYDADDPVIIDWLGKNKVKAQLVPFSLKDKVEFGADVEDNKIRIKLNKDILTMDISKIALQGKHNTKNAMASSMAAQMMKARRQVIKESLEDFEGAEHRLEKVLRINGVQYINDSKATNVNATFYALECMEVPTVWIVGGVDKGNDYLDLMPLVREKVKAVICLGVDNAKIIQTFGKVVDVIVETTSVVDAVKTAYKLTGKGDAVLLSPACASFDLFENYEDRGRQFKNAVRHL